MRIFFLLLLVIISLKTEAQIIITSADMPLPTDTFRMSTASNPQNFNFQQTGTNFLWDFSGLVAVDQRLEHYVAISDAPMIYNLVFMYPMVATVAAERPNDQIATVAINNGFNFYKTSSTAFAEVGFGAEVQGSPIPVKYKSEDIIYQLPLAFGTNFSSTAKWDLSIPTLGSIDETRHRVNIVDGWGTVKTPLGTFSCLRVMSSVTQIDTVIYNAAPFPLPPITTQYTEYIWLANGFGHPLVKATVRQQNIQVDYMDSIKSFMGFFQNQMVKDDIAIVPNPATTEFSLISGLNLNNLDVEILNLEGKIISRSKWFSNSTIDIKNISKGIYFVKIYKDDQIYIKKLIIN